MVVLMLNATKMVLLNQPYCVFDFVLKVCYNSPNLRYIDGTTMLALLDFTLITNNISPETSQISIVINISICKSETRWKFTKGILE